MMDTYELCSYSPSAETVATMYPLIFAFLILLRSTVVSAGDTAWHMDVTNVLVNEELDPVITPNAQASHMHKVIGGSRFGASYEYEDYNSAQCSSSYLQADKSNYWMPSESAFFRVQGVCSECLRSLLDR